MLASSFVSILSSPAFSAAFLAGLRKSVSGSREVESGVVVYGGCVAALE
jgi:hypothetical protein